MPSGAETEGSHDRTRPWEQCPSVSTTPGPRTSVTPSGRTAASEGLASGGLRGSIKSP